MIRKAFRKAWRWLDAVRRLWLHLRDHLRLIAPCWFAIGVTLAMCFATRHPQTVDALAALAAESGLISGRHFAMLTTLLLFCVAVWYISRVLLYVSYDKSAKDLSRWESRLVTWLPRSLGVLPILAAAYAFLLTRDFPFVMMYLVIAGMFLAALHMRRLWLPDKDKLTPLEALQPRLSTTTRWVVFAAISATILILIAVWLEPVAVPQRVGPLGVIYVAGACWTIVVSMLLIYPTRRFKLPSLVMAVVLLAVVFGLWNDNHKVEPITDTFDGVQQRPTLAQQFDAWLKHRARAQTRWTDGSPYPVFVVTADGGGIRAAYWTAAVLAEIRRRAPDFPCHVFAMSGVSGGSLGLATFASRQADVSYLTDNLSQLCTEDAVSDYSRADSRKVIATTQTDPTTLADARRKLRVELDALSHDFLAPVLAGALFPDLIQRFLPIPIMPDRASYLETAWEEAWPRAWQAEGRDNPLARMFTARGWATVDSSFFSQDFLDLWQGELRLLTPSLFLNATRVENGRRAVVSNLRFGEQHADGDHDASTLDLAIDLLDRLDGSVTLSQAVHLSARFTYLSPAATVTYRTTGETARIVDGGYFENSGAVTGRELVAALRDFCAHPDVALPCEVHVLMISNDVNSPNNWQRMQIGSWRTRQDGGCVCLEQGACDRRLTSSRDDYHPDHSALLAETLSPIRALFATRSARGYLAESQLFGDIPCRTYRAQLLTIKRRAIPLGWMLSDELRRAMEVQAAGDRAVLCVADLIDTGNCDSRKLLGSDSGDDRGEDR